MKKRLLATALCASMVLSSTVALAAPSTGATGSGNLTGTGTNEGLVDTEIYSVTLPTVSAGTYDFFLDPQSNIEGTKSGDFRYTGFTPSGTTNGYFKTTASTMTEKSASASVVNASYHDLDVTVKVEVTGNKAISIEELGDSGKITNTTPTMFMGLESEVKEDSSNSGSLPSPGTKNTSYVPSSGTLEKTFKLTGDSKDYVKSWSTDKYTMANKGSAHADSTLDFNLVVGCNTTAQADWTGDAAKEAPGVTVTWSYAKHVEGPQVVTSKDDSAKTITVAISGLSSEKAFTSMSMSDGTTQYDYNAVPAAVTKTGNDESSVNIVLATAWYEGFAGKTVTFTATLKDGSNVTGTIAIP